jgi:hypothetical protein
MEKALAATDRLIRETQRIIIELEKSNAAFRCSAEQMRRELAARRSCVPEASGEQQAGGESV